MQISYFRANDNVSSSFQPVYYMYHRNIFDDMFIMVLADVNGTKKNLVLFICLFYHFPLYCAVSSSVLKNFTLNFRTV